MISFGLTDQICIYFFKRINEMIKLPGGKSLANTQGYEDARLGTLLVLKTRKGSSIFLYSFKESGKEGK